ncbi:response regulator [Alishewanella tabrizica]|uniref:DNA-binding response regulator n=1 Tax=Alishewanella tabrizica TaxID=671278 RepID=A0ABQ2WES4_9ALTE|nr:response regulator transcription factor [Alishewanella tabrizica]GGW48806.1 DNA-binding response regulator [Alishewanella tabrizica]
MYKVMLVDDQKLIRDGIRSLLAISGQIEVIAEAADGTHVIALCQAQQPDVILLDLSMPIMDGVQTLQALQQANIEIPVLVLTTFDEHDLVLNSIQAGAKGFLLKDVSLDTLVSAIAALANGQSFFQPTITERLLTQVKKNPKTTFSKPSAFEPLSDKELEILHLMAAGYSNKEIATALYKSEGTVKNQCSTILSKLGVRDRTRAVLLALELGLITS